MLQRTSAIIGSAIFLVIAPGFVAVLMPWWLSQWDVEPAFFGFAAIRYVGLVLIALGSIGLLDSFARFAIQGLGTPAPVYPTKHLVITGLYRFVRNPMYIGVVSAILGQGLFFGNLHVLEYGVIVWLLMHLFVVAYEEPTMRASFPEDYAKF